MENIQNFTLFLDRDGVINERLPGAYVRDVSEFIFVKGSLKAIVDLSKIFARIIVVTNQQGIGKGVMTEADLQKVHAYFLQEVEEAGGRIDAIYHCPDLASSNSVYRKPNPGMAMQAKLDFPEIDFQKSIMVGDSLSDMEFGEKLGMITVYVEGKAEEAEKNKARTFDFRVNSLQEWVAQLTSR